MRSDAQLFGCLWLIIANLAVAILPSLLNSRAIFPRVGTNNAAASACVVWRRQTQSVCDVTSFITQARYSGGQPRLMLWVLVLCALSRPVMGQWLMPRDPSRGPWPEGIPRHPAASQLESFLPDPPTSDQVDYLSHDEFVDADMVLDSPNCCGSNVFGWEVFPAGLIYQTNLANVKEPRLAARIVDSHRDTTLWEANVGGRVGLLRRGTTGATFPSGFQLDAEGSAQMRLDVPHKVDLLAADYRGGLLGTWGNQYSQWKFGYYHLSSHVGDEFLQRPENHDFERLNFSRDALVLGHSIYLTNWWRVYGEAGWAFYTDVCDPWEFQFGIEYVPYCSTGLAGAPFIATNVHLRQEVGFGGNFTFQAGWSWRGRHSGNLMRMGLHYYNGKSSQYSFFNQHEQTIGFGVWYDQ